MPGPATPPQPADDGAAPAYRRNIPNVLTVLRTYLVEEVDITFDGSGDSGCIDQIIFYPNPPAADRQPDWTEFAYHATRLVITADDARCQDTLYSGPLEDALQELAIEYIEETYIDWYNGDGGYGTLRINVIEGTIDLEIMTRIHDTSCAHTSIVDINDVLNDD